ncbi:hypothetical protein Pst134EA_019068 [Puccinia striiformis f. sp. tritici]|uniref:hypothetical protein n=1 Tax=Puccinia striiformis f. sp. tritici TaxID=168172 RepID=UPI0020078E53|nr:hypothetical protein Pst134EA_019068 [Puccinia striiformis f. sp. tritici]KAH9449156.1 hypothetical protein Pst134EB_019990 [Puccinia striiformis f. sp. tritici]KAH9458914.1 hypothetical protein Pst134EA_019068 [Puccinia striiformis f. sp. tritici]KAI9615496.1 hypothetical protein H4Q26_011437 [Puccinia striiformis f. sp. tritici PST-130]
MAQTTTTDPFAAIYKAQPGQLPSSLSIDSYHNKREQGTDRESQSTQNLFSPSLAGERDRVVRKRMLSNPESYLLPSPSISSTPRTKSKLSTSNITLKEDEGAHTRNKPRFRSETSNPNIIQSSFYTTPPSGPSAGIFFEPPRSLDTLLTKKTRSVFNNTPLFLQDVEDQLTDDSHRRFSFAFSRAIMKGDTTLDLNDSQIHTIPDLAELVEEQKTGHLKDKVKAIATIERLVVGDNPHQHNTINNRQTITRARSVPIVSFSAPTHTASLYLANNQLNSTSFAGLERICYFQGLENLSLRGNKLTEIPDQFSLKLHNLKSLNLSYNLLKFLPSSILSLKNCKLILSGNPWYNNKSQQLMIKDRSMDEEDQEQFKWISESKGVFYISSSSANTINTFLPIKDNHIQPTPPSIPSLLETCIRKLCITNSNLTTEEAEETFIDQDSINQHHQSDPEEEEQLTNLPTRIQEIISDPISYFYRCDLCKSKLTLKPNTLTISHHHDQPRYAFQFFQENDGFIGLTPFSNHQSQSQSEPESHSTTHNHQSVDQNGQSVDHNVIHQSVVVDLNPHQNLIPIRWNICSLNCCIEHLINQ